MTLVTKNLTINDTIYTFKMPIGRIIMYEREVGKPISSIDDKNFESLSKLLKYAIQKDGKYLTEIEFNEFLNSISINEFADCMSALMEVITTQKK